MTLHIFVKSKHAAKAIAVELFNRKLILNAVINENITSLEQNGTEIIEKNMTVLITLGKAINYTEITALINQMFSNDTPLVYSMPILNHNSDANKLGTNKE